MITESSTVSFKQNPGEMLKQVQYRHNIVLINENDKPIAALINAKLFERICLMQNHFDALCQRIETGFANIPETEGLAEIDATVAIERAQARLLTKSYLVP